MSMDLTKQFVAEYDAQISRDQLAQMTGDKAVESAAQTLAHADSNPCFEQGNTDDCDWYRRAARAVLAAAVATVTACR